MLRGYHSVTKKGIAHHSLPALVGRSWQGPSCGAQAQREGCSERQKDTDRVGPTHN